VAKKVNVALPRAHAEQHRVLLEAKRFNALCCGRRWGKTTIATDRIIRPALAGHPVAWFAPTYKYLTDVFQDVRRRVKPMIKAMDASDRRIELYGGGRIEFWTLDVPDAGRGRKYKRIVVDEAALVKNLEAAWQQSLRATLTDLRGSAWFLSTPKGTANYFYKLYQRGQDPLNTQWASWQMPTSTNPFMAPEEIEAAKEDLTDLAFAQEYLAQFVSWAGAVFRRIIDCTDNAIPVTTAAMIGVDWGRTGDYTVFTALSAAGHLVAMDRFRGIEYKMQRERLRAFWERLGRRAWIVAETNSMGAPVVEQLQQDKLPVVGFWTTNPTKAAIIQSLALAFERGVIKIPNDPVLVGELQAFEGKPSRSGLMVYGAPPGVHDDTVLSLAFAWAGLQIPKDKQIYVDPNGGFTNLPRKYEISPI
jgi:hypothetical protein